MWVWALCGSRHFKPMSYSVWLHWPHRAELIIVSLGGPKRAAEQAVEDGCGAVFEHGRSVLRAHNACSA
jgi:hypothetical protein